MPLSYLDPTSAHVTPVALRSELICSRGDRSEVNGNPCLSRRVHPTQPSQGDRASQLIYLRGDQGGTKRSPLPFCGGRP